jgi:negative regulator of sigma E activity
MTGDREACWERFNAAADAYLHRGDANPAKEFLASVEAKFGAEVAERQRKELWNWIKARQK